MEWEGRFGADWIAAVQGGVHDADYEAEVAKDVDEGVFVEGLGEVLDPSLGVCLLYPVLDLEIC